jgi:hypothetical protein
VRNDRFLKQAEGVAEAPLLFAGIDGQWQATGIAQRRIEQHKCDAENLCSTAPLR